MRPEETRSPISDLPIRTPTGTTSCVYSKTDTGTLLVLNRHSCISTNRVSSTFVITPLSVSTFSGRKQGVDLRRSPIVIFIFVFSSSISSLTFSIIYDGYTSRVRVHAFIVSFFLDSHHLIVFFSLIGVILLSSSLPFIFVVPTS